MKQLIAGSMVSLSLAGIVSASEVEPSWLSPSIGPLSPSAHFYGAIGDSSGDAEALAVGHHDPTREKGTVQGIELGLSLRLEMIEGFAVHTFSYGGEEEWENGWEEAFLKVKNLPGGFEIRGGRMLGRFGQQNARHLHAWDFVDTPLALGRFLGEDGLAFDGGDITWLKQGIDTTYGITIAYGEARSHGHHGHDDHADHDHEGDHDHHDDDHEDIAWDDNILSGRIFAQLRRDDFVSYEAGFSVAMGDEEEGRNVAVYGIDLAYRWRENGLLPGGRALNWVTEILYRDVESKSAGHHEDEHDDDHEDHHDHDMLPGGGEFGFYSQVIYTFNPKLDVGTRIGYVEGNKKLGTDERFRISPAITAYLDPYRRTSLRLQYNYDDLPNGQDEHSIWVQLGLSFGGQEVR